MYRGHIALKDSEKPSEEFLAKDYKYLPYGLEVVQYFKQDGSEATLFIPYSSMRYAKFSKKDD